MAPTTSKGNTGKGPKKSISKSSKPSGASKVKKRTGPKPTPTQHKPKPLTATDKKKKPAHLRYTEKQLNIPQLNGIRPAGVQKPPNQKKGKVFVDDKESMNAIMAMVMAEKEGNIESKMMRARQMEEVREAKRLEAEKRATSKKQDLEDRKNEIKGDKKRQRYARNDKATPPSDAADSAKGTKKKRVSFG